MISAKKYRDEILGIQNEQEFNRAAVAIFNYQINAVEIYKRFTQLLKFNTDNINHFSQFPFLPVSLFKNHTITDQPHTPDFYFGSSGTTGRNRSRHFIHDISLYEESLMRGFEKIYGDPRQYCFLALLPSYLERTDSSLVYMAEQLIKASGHSESGFYLNNYDELHNKLMLLKTKKSKIFLIGVTYALMDLFEQFQIKIPDAIIMETGGMKGRRKEIIREELHETLKKKSGVSTIHSEYGMTELLSQAYSKGEGVFSCPPWMKVIIRDLHDPLQNLPIGQTGNICIVDLANMHSCAFIATQDLGRMINHHHFEVLGRMDNSELRGCNLMIA